MKPAYLFLFVFALIVVVAGCKKRQYSSNHHSYVPPKGLDTLVNISAKINGQNFNTDTVTAYYVKYSGDSAKVDLLISATVPAGNTARTISMTLFNYIGPADYDITPPYTRATCYIGSNRYYATTGKITVTDDSPYGITGTFSFTADTISVTEGQFNVAHP